jgi:hypothetical protein
MSSRYVFLAQSALSFRSHIYSLKGMRSPDDICTIHSPISSPSLPPFETLCTAELTVSCYRDCRSTNLSSWLTQDIQTPVPPSHSIGDTGAVAIVSYWCY